MLLFKLTIAVTTLQSVISCPAAKKSNLRAEDVKEYHRQLSQVIDVESQRLTATNSLMNAPVCSKPLNRLTAGTQAADNNIQTVYRGVRTFFYNLLDATANGTPLANVLVGTVPVATSVSKDPLSLFPLNTPAPSNLAAHQKAYRIANLIGNALRLAFHDAGEVDIRTTDRFGSDGCLADNGPNSGLKEVNVIARTIIEPLWQEYCDKISRADFWVLFGKIAAESALANGRFNTAIIAEGGVVIGNPSPLMPYLNIPFQYGRSDAAGPNCDAGSFRADGVTNRLPGHLPGLSEFTEVYVNQMGLDVRTGVVLSGAHSVGHVHTQFSGYGFNDNLAALEADPLTNAWDESPWIFDNVYYDSLAGEFWLNNNFSPNQIVSHGVTGIPTVPSNSGETFWAVQVAPGVLQQVPACIGGQVGPPAIPAASCGAAAIVGAVPPVPNAAALLATVPPGAEVLFCVVNGVTRYATESLEANPADSWRSLSQFANAADITNTCNCMQFFASPQLLDARIFSNRGCALANHPKTIMLNADMAQNFPISGEGGVKNLIAANPGAIQDLGVGDIGELCAPFVVSDGARAANGIKNANQAARNTNNVFPVAQLALASTTTKITSQGFGCVKNSRGNPPNFIGARNTQTIASTLLPKDPNNVAVSLWATVQSFMTGGIAGSCVEGISTYKNPLDGNRNPYTGATQAAVSTYGTYSGSVTRPLVGTRRFIGQNSINGLAANAPCTEATNPLGEGLHTFYREFEVAYTKMTTSGFIYSTVFQSQRVINGVASQVVVPYTAPLGAKASSPLGTLFDIKLLNPNQRLADVNRGAIQPPIVNLPPLRLPNGVTFSAGVNGQMTATGVPGYPNPLYGSSTCYIQENC